MGPSILTPLQSRVLRRFFEWGIGDRGYVLSGGTALAEAYLKHRYSDDLDFFTGNDSDLRVDVPAFEAVLRDLGLEMTGGERNEQHCKVFVSLPESPSEFLKLDFVKDAHAKLGAPTQQDGWVADSLEDISVNKVCCVYDRTPPEPKDFVDLSFILHETGFTLDYLLHRARQKTAAFDTEDGILEFAGSLLRVREIELFPRMIKESTLDDLRSHLVPLAEELIRKVGPGRE